MKLGEKKLLVRVVEPVSFGKVVFGPQHLDLSLHNNQNVFLPFEKTLEVSNFLY
jgi:hypothetical protein